MAMVSGLQHHPSGDCFDNHVDRDYHYIDVHPIAASMGAEIHLRNGYTLQNMSQEQVQEIQHALFHRKMIFFRGIVMTLDEQETFSTHFGDFAEDAYTGGKDSGHPHVLPLVREANNRSKMVIGSGWHIDSAFLGHPLSITILRSVEVPPFGGDTLFRNSALALKTLSPTYRNMIRDLQVRFSMRDLLRSAQQSIDLNTEDTDSPLSKLVLTVANAPGGVETYPKSLQSKLIGTAHPMIREHPVTGEEALMIDQDYAIGIEGMTPEESTLLLSFLLHHLTQPAFSCRLRWESNMLVMWDNRLCVHQAFNDYQGYRRELYRTTLA